MADMIFEKAFAKLNLFLEVTGKREDGYHDIESVMTAIPIYDTVCIEPIPNGITVACNTHSCVGAENLESLPADDNIVYKAAEAFFEKLDEKGITHAGAAISLEKRIPVCAGLGGGSSDAAAVMRILDSLYKESLSREEILGAAVSVGADVPFCFVGGTALCLGIGDVMTPIYPKCDLHGILTVEKVPKASTGAAYSKIDALGDRVPRSSENIVSALEKGDFYGVACSVYNIFEYACDYGRGCAGVLAAAGIENVCLSGAGPSFFALCDDEDKTEKARRMLSENGYPAFVF